MEIKINKEICGYNEALFFGLSTRQFLCSALAVAAAAGIYFGLKGIIGRNGKLAVHGSRRAHCGNGIFPV